MVAPVERLGRFVMVRDVEGTLYAVAPTAVLAGGRAMRFAEDLHTVASWFSGDRPR